MSMKKLICLAALAAGLGANAEGRLKLTGTIDGLPDGTLVHLGGINHPDRDSTVIANHSFKFDRAMTKGDVYVLWVGEDNDENKGTVLYLEPGTVNITGKGPYFQHAVFSGSSFVQDYQDLNALMYNDDAFKGWQTLDNDMATAKSVGDLEKFHQLDELNASYTMKRKELARQWVLSHPNSPVSTFVINIFLQPYDRAIARELLDKLTPAAKNNVLAGQLAEQLNANEATALDKPAPGFTQPDAAGKNVSLADFKGKYVLVDFWASWCKPCRELTPKLKALYQKYKDKNFTIVSISMDTDKSKWLAAMKEDQLPWIQLSDLQKENSAGKAYHVLAIPTTFLIDPNGKIIGFGNDEKMIEEKLGK